jgi:hypothetical protein
MEYDGGAVHMVPTILGHDIFLEPTLIIFIIGINVRHKKINLHLIFSRTIILIVFSRKIDVGA